MGEIPVENLLGGPYGLWQTASEKRKMPKNVFKDSRTSIFKTCYYRKYDREFSECTRSSFVKSYSQLLHIFYELYNMKI
jgi:hypothetical protein